MQTRPVEILLVEPDAELAEMMQECMQSLPGNVTVAPTAGAALREELTARHDVLVLSSDLPDAGWVDLVRELRVSNRGPIVLLASEPTTGEVIEAMRMGIRDVILKPFDLGHVAMLIGRAGHRAAIRRRKQLRYQRLRRLTGRIIRERRDLRQRIDLICRDFVHAYRRLAQRVSDADLIPHK
jgi:DNA-binding response OmpR family regulator